jgi:hypothetical protein
VLLATKTQDFEGNNKRNDWINCAVLLLDVLDVPDGLKAFLKLIFL